VGLRSSWEVRVYWRKNSSFDLKYQYFEVRNVVLEWQINLLGVQFHIELYYYSSVAVTDTEHYTVLEGPSLPTPSLDVKALPQD